MSDISAAVGAASGAQGSEITAATVQHLADLARIELTDSEISQLTSDLENILQSIAKVGEVATPDVAPTSHPLPITNVMRADEVADVLTIEEVLQNAPDAADGMFRVSSILGEEQ